MLWFYRRAIVLLTGFVLILAVIRLVESSQPSPLGVLFTNPDGSACRRPCVFGIRPDETSLPDAFKLLKSHALTKDFSSPGGSGGNATRFTLSRGLSDIGIASAPDGSVDSVAVLFSPASDQHEQAVAFGQVTLGDVIAEYGRPDIVVRIFGSLFLIVGDDRTIFRIYLGTNDDAELKPNTPLRSLMLFDHADCSRPLIPRMVSPWLGFVDTAKYSAAATTPILFAPHSPWAEMGKLGLVGCPP